MTDYIQRGEKKGLRCCESCGRDTRGYYYARCIGKPPKIERTGHPPDDPLEDDYGEESDADSVCDDNPGDMSGKWRRRDE